METKNTVTCKVCGAEIAKSAKACPQCGARRKHPVIGTLVLFLSVILIISGIAGLTSKDDEPKKVDEYVDQTQNTETQKTEFGIGEKVELKNIIVTLKNVAENSGSMFNEPTEGNIFLLCEFEIENNSSQAINVSSLLSFEGYCDDYAISLSFGALLETDKNQLDGTVAPGKKMDGVIGYEVPTDWKELEIKFTPNFWSNKSITFTAKKTESQKTEFGIGEGSEQPKDDGKKTEYSIGDYGADRCSCRTSAEADCRRKEYGGCK